MDPLLKKAFSALATTSLLFSSLMAFSSDGHEAHQSDQIQPKASAVAHSYVSIDLSTNTPSITQPTASSSVSTASITSKSGASYRSDYNTWSINNTNGSGIELSFELSSPTLLQLALRDAYVINAGGTSSDLIVKVNGAQLGSQPYRDTNSSWHETVLDIPSSMLNAGTNKILLTLDSGSAPLFVQKIDLLPRNIYSSDGELSTTIYAQFGENEQLVANGTNIGDIWTRAYGLASTTELIPGPTLFYKPGDLLKVNLVNRLDTEALKQFEQGEADNLSNAGGGPSSDEILDNLGDKVRQEVNIPHNLNNTNLHVHGLHVDPEKDDVTIVIVPEDEAGTVGEYDAPHHVPTTAEELGQLNEGSVADQAVKPGDWLYEYRIPKNHLPGTHWFHPHKHGSTAAQLENGMAGSMVIQEPKDLAIFPNQQGTEWSQRFDQVMMIQQIANYGLQQGTGGGKQAVSNSTSPVTVLNGIHQPSHKMAPSQIIRWRFVNAGANHRAFNHMWMGKATGELDQSGNPIYVSQPVYAVAFDGITASEKTEVTPGTPLLLAPGNRTDVVFQVPEDAQDDSVYTLFKYYPTNISIVDTSYYDDDEIVKNIKDYLIWDCSTYNAGSSTPPAKACTHGSAVQPLTSAFAPVTNPYLLQPINETVSASSNSYGENFDSMKVKWVGTATTAPTSTTPIVPLIKVADNQGSLTIDFALTDQFPANGDCASGKGCAGKWQPQFDGFGGGAVNAEQLLNVFVDTSLTATGPTALPTDTYLSTISPTGSFSNGIKAPGFSSGIPPYVSPFEDKDILQSRPVTFDKSGAAIEVQGTNTTPTGTAGTSSGKAKVNQFTLNGRPFALNDVIGNSTSKVNDRLADGVTLSELKRVGTGSSSSSTSATDPTQCTKTGTTACLDIKEKLSFESSNNGTTWTNGVCTATPPGKCTDDGSNNTTETTYYWANPGYFQKVEYDSSKSAYRYAADNIQPNWTDISGLSAPAVVNPSNKYGPLTTGSVNGLPGMPIATTAEEWVLVNNSDIGHPFHIHINPFFVMEVGQLSYETFADGKKEWLMRSVSINDLPSINSVESNSIDGNAGAVSPAPTSPDAYQTSNDINHFVGNWWDTVIVPPHGYVKVRYWMNVPNQTGSGTTAAVEDDFNKIGIWVYHCHILRHEDRGMMMPVVTQKRTVIPVAK